MNDPSHSRENATIDLEELRAQLRKMTDTELRRFGREALKLSSPGADPGKQPREASLIHLEEARAESKRRIKPSPSGRLPDV